MMNTASDDIHHFIINFRKLSMNNEKIQMKGICLVGNV